MPDDLDDIELKLTDEEHELLMRIAVELGLDDPPDPLSGVIALMIRHLYAQAGGDIAKAAEILIASKEPAELPAPIETTEQEEQP